MTKKLAYSYTVLRYVHDVLTGEFINVGVVLYAPSIGALRIKTRSTIGRIRDAFPDLRRTAFTASMRSVNRGIRRIAKDALKTSLLSRDLDAGAIARLALPGDDSSLQWSPVGGGVTDDLDAALNRLYTRLVARYDVHVPHRRTDADVWRPVQEKLAQRKLSLQLKEKVIVGSSDEIVFKHAWKNGRWHVYEPISLDMADANGIKDKARKWLGHLSAVADGAHERVNLNLLLGAPQDASLRKAYDNAVSILSKAPFQSSIYGDDRVDELVDKIEDDIRTHQP